jgi:hypothetical protein
MVRCVPPACIQDFGSQTFPRIFSTFLLKKAKPRDESGMCHYGSELSSTITQRERRMAPCKGASQCHTEKMDQCSIGSNSNSHRKGTSFAKRKTGGRKWNVPLWTRMRFHYHAEGVDQVSVFICYFTLTSYECIY